MLFDHYLTFLEQVLTPNRLRHSLGVMQVMGELVDIYRLDREQALIAGLLHDAAKDLAPERYEQIVNEAAIEIRFECERDYMHYLHAPVGAYFVHKELGITDPLVLDAIARHTYFGDGEHFDGPLLWCLKFSDVLEPNRSWYKVPKLRTGFARLREIVYSGSLAEGARLLTGWLMRWYREIGVLVHPNMKRAYQELSRKLDVEDDPSWESSGLELP